MPESTPPSADCKTCQLIWQRFADPDYVEEVNFGSFEDALSAKCSVHKPLIQAFNDYVQKLNSDNPEWERPNSQDVGFTKHVDKFSVMIAESIADLGWYWDLLLVNKSSVDGHPGTGRIVDPDWVDLEILKKWKHTCLSSHGAQCENPLKLPPTRPAWLIDVEKKCLVSGQVPASFVALSYGNGKPTESIVDEQMVTKIQEQDALETPEFSELLKPVIREAMYITSVIGERYLWVDTLCITYQEPVAAAEQVKLMGEIFGNAVVTIIAAGESRGENNDEDDKEGPENYIEPTLPGIKAVSNPRKMDQTLIPFGEEQLLVRNTGVFSMVSGTPYYNHGWTYQQLEMSKRKILFNNGEIHWQCQCNVWHEEMVIGAEADRYIDTRLRTVMAGFPDLESLSHHFENFNERDLEFDQDVIPAISSLASAASRTFEGGFLFGISEMFLEHALTWEPQWGHTNLRRRAKSIGTAENSSKALGIPSWSWMAWQGMTSNGYGEGARFNDRANWVEESIPTTEWYTSKSPRDPPSERRRIRSTWYENRDRYKDFTKLLPPGWIRHDAPSTMSSENEPFLHPDGCDKYIFKHPALPDPDTSTEGWYYPFPVVNVETTSPVTPEQTQYLFCETTKVRLLGYQKEEDNIAVLFNNSGEKVGQLHLHNEEYLARFPKPAAEGEAQKVPGLPVDLVLVCKKKKYSNVWDEEKEDSKPTFEKENTCAVLWVEWEDGVAYRLASGRVQAAEWDKLDHEKIPLVLG